MIDIYEKKIKEFVKEHNIEHLEKEMRYFVFEALREQRRKDNLEYEKTLNCLRENQYWLERKR